MVAEVFAGQHFVRFDAHAGSDLPGGLRVIPGHHDGPDAGPLVTASTASFTPGRGGSSMEIRPDQLQALFQPVKGRVPFGRRDGLLRHCHHPVSLAGLVLEGGLYVGRRPRPRGGGPPRARRHVQRIPAVVLAEHGPGLPAVAEAALPDDAPPAAGTRSCPIFSAMARSVGDTDVSLMASPAAASTSFSPYGG